MKRPHSSTIRKDPVFLDPAYPTYRGYVPPTNNTRNDDDDNRSDHDDDRSPPTATATSSTSSSCLDRVDARIISPQEFFDSYVTRRKPCLLHNLLFVREGEARMDSTRQEDATTPGPPTTASLKLDPTGRLLQSLATRLKDTTFQMEVRESIRETFGQNRTTQRQVEMTFGDFLHQVPNHQKHLYYLSTQQPQKKQDARRNANDGAYDPSFSPLVNALEETMTGQNHPTQRVRRALERVRELAGHLVLDSKHGWLGFAASTNSHNNNGGDGKDGVSSTAPSSSSSGSGLHHDFHDNFNVQLVGSKIWTLYPPVDYPHIPLYGTVHGLHGFNGLICYRDNVTRADGVPLSLLLSDDDDDGDDDEDDSEGENRVTMPFGFAEGEDSENDEDEGSEGHDDDDDDENAKDAYGDDKDNNNTTTGGGRASREVQDAAATKRQGAERRPNSFSPVDMTLSVEDRAQQYPGFRPRHEVTVRVRAGEALYLPASWFHSVSSLADAASGPADLDATPASSHPPYHLAVNYWYHPPDQDSYPQPYRNDYWANHAKTEQSFKSERPSTEK